MNYYFLGIGGIGMSALARFFHQRGDVVSGYDRTESALTKKLVEEGIPVHYVDDPGLIPDQVDLVVYTPAVPMSNVEYQYLLKRGVPIKKRSQVLGELTKGKKCIAVAGTHGKTSTSSLLAHLLTNSPLGCSSFLGGISKNFGTNMTVDNKSEYVVVEADEYDRSFLQLHPYCSVITATDPDHLDIYGTHENMLEAFRQFASQTEVGGMLILKQGLSLFDDEHCHEHGECHHDHHHAVDYDLQDVKLMNYTSQGIEADYYPWNVRSYKGDIFFDLRTPQGVIYDLQLANSSLYNVENAVAASAVALSLGVGQDDLRQGLKTFEGVLRRFDYRIKTDTFVMIDDYAHHPQEIEACLNSIKFLYPNKRIVGVFQPHLYTRTRDLAEGFAQALQQLDEIVLMPIYPARELPIPGVTSKTIMNLIPTHNKYLCTPEQVLDLVPILNADVVVTLGAGDIDRLVPQLQERLQNSLLNK